jgi:AraC family transcriptional regulator of adaptative response / DNA-3-methyladenine glycosylase II
MRDGQAPAALERFEVRVAAREPFELAPLLQFLAARALRGVEEVSSDSYRRTIAIDRSVGVVDVSAMPGMTAVRVRTAGLPARALWPVVTRINRVLDLAADAPGIAAHLRRDPRLAGRIPRSGVRVPGAWDAFEAGVRALLGQQISVAAARTLLARLIEQCGTKLERNVAGAFESGEPQAAPPLTHVFPTPQQVADADLSQFGVPRTRARPRSRRSRARSRTATLDLVTPRPLDEHVAALTALPGIGDWTAHYLAMRALGEPDAFPAGDLGVRQALATNGKLPSERDVLAHAEAWRPWRAYAVIALWSGLTSAKDSTGRKE